MTTNQTIDGVPVFYAIDPLDAYPEPVGTDDKIERSNGALWVHLNGKRSKLIGLQSLDFLISQLVQIKGEIFGTKPAAQTQVKPVAWQYRVSAGPQTGWSLWHDGKGEEFKQSYQVETRPLYAEQPAPVADLLEQIERLKAENRQMIQASTSRFMGGTDPVAAPNIIDALGVLFGKPAPVAVVLPERKHVPDFTQHPMLNKEYQGFNNCLDEVTRLNTR